MKTLHPALLVAVIALAGCGKSNLGTVTGAVTVDGAPAKAGSIAFFPTNGKSPTAGGEIHDGRYTATVSPGPAKVEIRVSKVVGQKKLYNTANSPVQPILAETLPAKYNDATELVFDVQPGTNEHDFALSTR